MATYRSIRALKVIRHDGQDHQPGTDNQDLVVRSEQATALVTLNAALDLGPATAPIKQGDVSGWYREGLLVWLDDGQGGPIMLGSVGGGVDGTVPMVVDGVVTWVPVANVFQQALGGTNFNPVVPPITITAIEDSTVEFNVLEAATTTVGVNRVVDFTVPTISYPDGLKFPAGATSVTNPLGGLRIKPDGTGTLWGRMYSYGTMPLVRFTVTNGVGDPVVGSLQFILTWVNHAPVTSPDSVTTTESTGIDVNVTANDVEWDSQTMIVTKVGGMAVSAGGAAVTLPNGEVYLKSNGQTLHITPATGFTGTWTIPYTVSDTLGMESPGFIYVMVASSAAAATSNWITDVNAVVPFDFAANPIAKNAIVYEPTTGATIKRITDVTQDLPGQTALYNAYSRYPTENMTGEYCLAFAGNSTSCLVIDRATGSVVASLAYDASGLPNHTIGAYHEVRWHYTLDHPYRVYYVRGQQFWMIEDVRDQDAGRTLIKDFSSEIDWLDLPTEGRKIYMDQEGNSSLDSDHWAWMAVYYDSAAGTYRVRAYLHYQVSANTVHLMYPSDLVRFTRIPGGESGLKTFRHRPNTVEMVPDGSGILIMTDRAYPDKFDAYVGTIFEAPYIWPLDFQPSTFVPFRIMCDSTHSGWSTVGGIWHMVHQDNRRDYWCAVPVSGPNKGYGNEGYVNPTTAALSPGVIDFHHDNDSFYPGMHFAICTNAADGWTLVSTYTTQGADTYGLGNALYMMKLVPEGIDSVKWHLAPTCNLFPAADKQDYNESPGSINLAGTRVYTCGDYNGTFPRSPVAGDPPDGPYSGSTYVDLFSIELPPNWANHFAPNAPQKINDPTVSGTASQGQRLTAVEASFNGFPVPTVSGNWQRGNVSTGIWADIAGATALTYDLGGADVDYLLRRRTRGANTSGYLDAYSAAVGPVVALPVPVVITSPSISGLAQQGAVLTGDDGTYTNSPTAFARKWYRRNPSTMAMTAIAGATATTYTQVSADIGFELVYEVTPSNGDGPGVTQLSAPTAVVVANPGSVSRVAHAVSTDPSPGSNALTRSSAAFDVEAGDLIVVSIDWNTNAGANTGVTITDTPANAFTAGTAAAHTGLHGRCQQFWAVASANQVGNVVTATNAGTSTPLNISVAVYRASSGTTWTHMDEKILETDYVPNPLSLPAVDMPNNSLAVAHWYQPYSIVGAISTSDTVVHTSNGVSWTTERIRGNSALAQVMSSADADRDYTRMAASVQVFQRT